MKSTGELPIGALGFIGLGNMGGAIALRLLRAGYPMTVLDLDGDKMSGSHQRRRDNSRDSPEKLPSVLPSLSHRFSPTTSRQLPAARTASRKRRKDGLVFVDLSSTTQELAIKVSESLRARGIEMLDAPVSGADIGATNGNLTIFVGGDYPAYQRCLPVLQHVGQMVTYLGTNGNGQIGKRINQMMQAMSELAIYEGLLLAKKMGLPLQMFARAASAGCAQTWRLDELVDNVFNHGEKKHRLRLHPGRTGNAIKMAEALGLKLEGTEAAHRVFSRNGWEIVIDFEKEELPDPV